MKATRLFVAAALGAFALAPHVALADPSTTTIGITLNPIVGGVHESFNDIVHLPPVPLPLFEVSHKTGPFELTAFGLPPTIAVPYTDAIQGSTALRLTILDATLRVWTPGGRFAIGAGETVYNQTTHYATADDFAPGGGERQYSRVVGGHYEIATRLPFRHGTIEANLRYAPVLLGTQVSTYDDGTPSRFDPERGKQIDGGVRYLRPAGAHGEFVVGVRYLNYTAAYDVPDLPLSDRNAAVLPNVGYLWKFGR